MQMATISLDNNHFVGPLPDTWTTSEDGVSLLSLTCLLLSDAVGGRGVSC